MHNGTYIIPDHENALSPCIVLWVTEYYLWSMTVTLFFNFKWWQISQYHWSKTNGSKFHHPRFMVSKHSIFIPILRDLFFSSFSSMKVQWSHSLTDDSYYLKTYHLSRFTWLLRYITINCPHCMVLRTLGAQVNTTDCWGRTPLHVCAEKGHPRCFR